MPKKIEFFFKTPPVRGVWKFEKPHFKRKNENHCLGVYDSLNEAPGRTECNAKNLNSVRCTVAEKIKKNSQKWPFFQKWPFLGIFFYFFSNGTSERVEVFCVAISVSWRFIWAIKHHNPMNFIFWLLMCFYKFSDPLYGGGVHIYFWFFCFVIFLTIMHRSSDSACSKHDWS